MNELLPIIQRMLDEDFFSPTKSRISKELGRKDKNIFYGRLSAVARDGKPVLGPAALESLCSDICYSYNISEYTLAHLVDIWDLAHRMAEQLSDGDFLNLVRKRFSVVKDTELRAELRALSKASALDYCYVLAIFYTLSLHLDPNAKKNTHVLIEVIQNVMRVLDAHYPENLSAHQIGNDYIDQARSIKLLGWCHLMNFVGRLICCYSNPSYLEEVVSSEFVTLPIGEESWWIAEDADTDKATLYYALLADEDRALYYVLGIEADRHAAIDPARCTYYRWGFMRTYDMLRMVQPQGNKLLQWGYYDFEYREEEGKQYICTCPNKDLNGKHTPLPLPETLVRIAGDSPWGQWIASQEEGIALNILAQKEIASMGLEDTNYEVTDVILSRHLCQIQYQLPKQLPEIVDISLEQYPSLNKISVWDDVYILRGPIDQSLFALWPDAGLVVKIKG